MVYEPNGANTNANTSVWAAGGYGPPGGGGYGGPPPGGGGYGGPPGGGPPGFGGPPGGPPPGGFGGPPGGPPPGGFGGPPGGGYGGPPPGGYGAPPPPGFGPPGGGFPPPGGPMMPGGGGDVNTTLPLVLGIISVFCCWPMAIPSIIFAVQAKSLRDQGQIDAARDKAKTGLICAIIGLVGGVLVGGAYFVLMAIGIANS